MGRWLCLAAILIVVGCDGADQEAVDLARKYGANIVVADDLSGDRVMVYASLRSDDVVWVSSGEKNTRVLIGQCSDHMQMLDALVERMRPGVKPARQAEHSAEWNEGYAAWHRWRLPGRMVPYDDGQKRKDWLDGWKARSTEESKKSK